MTDNERAMYTGIAMSRNTEVTLRWSRSQMFIILHSAAFSLVAARPLPSHFNFVMGGVGVAMAILWFVTIWRTDQWVDYWQSRLSALERSEHQPIQIYVYEGPDFQRVSSRPPTFHQILLALPIAAAIGWIVHIVTAFYTLKGGNL